MNTTQFKIIKKITSPKYTLPILKNVQVKGNLAFATNLETSYQTKLEGVEGVELNGVYDLDSLRLGKPLKVDEYDAFPELKKEKYHLKIYTDTDVVKKLLRVVSKDKTRPVLENIALINPGSPYLVACDGYILSLGLVRMEGGFDESIILSSEFMKLAVDLVGKGDIVIEVGDELCQLNIGDEKLIGKLVQLQYPDVMELIKKIK